MRKDGLKKMTLTIHVEGKMDRGNQRMKLLMQLLKMLGRTGIIRDEEKTVFFKKIYKGQEIVESNGCLRPEKTTSIGKEVAFKSD